MMNTDKTYAEKIASEYAPKETRKVVALRKLDNRAKRPANIFAYTFGTVMSLLLGVKPYNTAKYGFNVHTAVIQAPFMKSRPRSIYGELADGQWFYHERRLRILLINICTAGGNTWYFFQMIVPATCSFGNRGRKVRGLSPVVLISLSKQSA